MGCSAQFWLMLDVQARKCVIHGKVMWWLNEETYAFYGVRAFNLGVYDDNKNC